MGTATFANLRPVNVTAKRIYTNTCCGGKLTSSARQPTDRSHKWKQQQQQQQQAFDALVSQFNAAPEKEVNYLALILRGSFSCSPLGYSILILTGKENNSPLHRYSYFI